MGAMRIGVGMTWRTAGGSAGGRRSVWGVEELANLARKVGWRSEPRVGSEKSGCPPDILQPAYLGQHRRKTPRGLGVRKHEMLAVDAPEPEGVSQTAMAAAGLLGAD